MKQLGILLLLVLVAGCAHVGIVASENNQARPDWAQEGRQSGYRLEGGQVVFVFDPKTDATVFGSNSMGWVKVDENELKTVSVAGPFNGWDPAAWPLKRQSDGTWTLTKPAAAVGSGEVSFKFVVNGDRWAEPPANAPNVEDNGVGNGGMNLYLKL